MIANIGQFMIMQVALSVPDQRPNAVMARCQACNHITAAHGPQITRCLGGVILICSNCQEQQTVANELLRQIGATQLSRWTDTTRPHVLPD